MSDRPSARSALPSPTPHPARYRRDLLPHADRIILRRRRPSYLPTFRSSLPGLLLGVTSPSGISDAMAQCSRRGSGPAANTTQFGSRDVAGVTVCLRRATLRVRSGPGRPVRPRPRSRPPHARGWTGGVASPPDAPAAPCRTRMCSLAGSPDLRRVAAAMFAPASLITAATFPRRPGVSSILDDQVAGMRDAAPSPLADLRDPDSSATTSADQARSDAGFRIPTIGVAQLVKLLVVTPGGCVFESPRLPVALLRT